MAVVILIIGMLVLFGGLGGTMFWLLKKTDPNRTDTSVKDTIDVAQDFLPFAAVACTAWITLCS